MLELKNIYKKYVVGTNSIFALKDVNVCFKRSEFVSILGPSGSGKTTLLNIIGGLDRYTSGDLLIDGKSTKEFTDNDWDAYRNSTIGIVFQSYNLISHLSVLDNVEMALRLSGVSSEERKERAIQVLKEVGLEDQIYKRPNQLSGGQMQRVAIARALVNNPKILLADEPTGALDSKTSIQIMDLIKKVSKDRLVILVTHNSKIAHDYSDRIINLLDGEIVSDSNPVKLDYNNNTSEKLINKKTSMSYFTALKSSFNNLMTKKGRTLITTFAGSIGIIGIALVLSISSGMNRFVSRMQSDTLAGFPLMINETVTTNYERDSRFNTKYDDYPDEKVIYPYDRTKNMTIHNNVLNEDFINCLKQMDTNFYNSISYSRAVSINLLAKTTSGGYVHINSDNRYFSEIPNSPEFITSQYDLLADSKYPSNFNEIALIVDYRNRIDVNALNAFGFEINDEYTFEDFLGKEFKVITNNDFYRNLGNQFVENTDYENMYHSSQTITLKIVGILRVKSDASSEILSPGFGYTTFLTDEILQIEDNSEIVKAQRKSPEISVLTGLPFNKQNTFEDTMKKIGGDTTPVSIQIYPVSFSAKDYIKEYIDAYNVDKPDEEKIIYTDLAEMISNSITSLINTITIILSAFAGISLVVSSIMIGIITFVSVIERTKEIGIMRSIGARKKDISRIFNAETIIIGFFAGLFGILIALILTYPINMIIERRINVSNFSYLPFFSGIILILLSTILTLVAGLIPSYIASKKDPVVALRTE